MLSLDILYYALAVGFLVLVGFASYALYQLAEALKSIHQVTEDVEDVTNDIQRTKEQIKLGIANGVLGIIGIFSRRKATTV